MVNEKTQSSNLLDFINNEEEEFVDNPYLGIGKKPKKVNNVKQYINNII